MDGSIRTISTRDLPPSLLASARLVGFTPSIASTYDERVSYGLYIPEKHYNPSPAVTLPKGPTTQVARTPSISDDLSTISRHPLHTHQSPGEDHLSSHIKIHARPQLQVVVAIHGTTRHTTPLLQAFVTLADDHRCAVLAPLFPAGVDGPNDWDSFKDLRRSNPQDRKRPLNADAALLDILDSDVPNRWPGLNTDKVIMVGFSGGASFAQRFTIVHPDRVHATSIAAPGSLTQIGAGLTWPAGLVDTDRIFGKNVDSQKVCHIKRWQLLVGSADTALEGSLEGLAQASEGWEYDAEKDWVEMVRKNMQPRAQILERFKDELRAKGVVVDVEIVQGARHSLVDLAPKVAEFVRKVLLASSTDTRKNGSTYC